MSNAKHTPGPWQFTAAREEHHMYPAGCTTHYGATVGMGGNARLIAAAPELLAACEVAYHVLKTTEAENYPETIGMLFKAISKAKGEK